MLSLEQAQAAIIERVQPATASERVPLAPAGGRYLAQSVVAQVDNPAFDNSAMDGYALRHVDVSAQGAALSLAGIARCGDAPGVLPPGATMRIYTGAPLPAGADAVVMQEDVRLDADGRVRMPAAVEASQHIRRRGEDFRAGEALYARGHRLRPYDIALLGAAGVAAVDVYRRPRALVLATGNELVAPGEPLAPGRIYESNRLPTLLRLQALGVEAVDGGIVVDDADALRTMLARTTDFDFIITSGGASVGDYDLVKKVFAELGEVTFWKARVKPGKPIAFGVLGRATHFFALPGNPVSSLVTFKLFVEPALAHWHHAPPETIEWSATAANDFRRQPGRTEFLRARLYRAEDRLYAEVLPGQGSHQLAALRQANALIRVEAESPGFDRGDTVQVLLL